MTPTEFRKSRIAAFIKENESLIRLAFSSNNTEEETVFLHREIGKMGKEAGLFPSATTKDLVAANKIKRVAVDFIGWRF